MSILDPEHPRCNRCGEAFRENGERAEVVNPVTRKFAEQGRSAYNAAPVVHVGCMNDEDVLA